MLNCFENSPILVGILNVTPDSFSDGGKYFSEENAIAHALKLSSQGASIVDIGGESTRPGSNPVGEAVELGRIISVVRKLSKEIALSIDTYRSATAQRCLECGAKIINDVSALRADPEMAAVIKEHGAQIVLMYSKESDSLPHASPEKKQYLNVIDTIESFLSMRINYALKCGINESNIIVDPGMGVFVSAEPKYCWELLARLNELVSRLRPFPLMIGTSRKGFLGGKVEDRDHISQITALIAHLKGATYIRTHNVLMAKEGFRLWKQSTT